MTKHPGKGGFQLERRTYVVLDQVVVDNFLGFETVRGAGRGEPSMNSFPSFSKTPYTSLNIKSHVNYGLDLHVI